MVLQVLCRVRLYAGLVLTPLILSAYASRAEAFPYSVEAVGEQSGDVNGGVFFGADLNNCTEIAYTCYPRNGDYRSRICIIKNGAATLVPNASDLTTRQQLAPLGLNDYGDTLGVINEGHYPTSGAGVLWRRGTLFLHSWPGASRQLVGSAISNRLDTASYSNGALDGQFIGRAIYAVSPGGTAVIMDGTKMRHRIKSLPGGLNSLDVELCVCCAHD